MSSKLAKRAKAARSNGEAVEIRKTTKCRKCGGTMVRKRLELTGGREEGLWACKNCGYTHPFDQTDHRYGIFK
jgi:rubrerythrin